VVETFVPWASTRAANGAIPASKNIPALSPSLLSTSAALPLVLRYLHALDSTEYAHEDASGYHFGAKSSVHAHIIAGICVLCLARDLAGSSAEVSLFMCPFELGSHDFAELGSHNFGQNPLFVFVIEGWSSTGTTWVTPCLSFPIRRILADGRQLRKNLFANSRNGTREQWRRSRMPT
jgi:hypothetical protein